MKWQETRLGKIEKRYGTPCFNMGMAQFFQMGFEGTKKVTDKMLDNNLKKLKEKETGLEIMTPEFQNDIIRIAREIGKCDLFQDVIPYIRMWMQIEPVVEEIELYREDMTGDAWNRLCDKADVEEENKVESLVIRGVFE